MKCDDVYDDLVFVAAMSTDKLAARLNISEEAADLVKTGAAGEAIERMAALTPDPTEASE